MNITPTYYITLKTLNLLQESLNTNEFSNEAKVTLTEIYVSIILGLHALHEFSQ